MSLVLLDPDKVLGEETESLELGNNARVEEQVQVEEVSMDLDIIEDDETVVVDAVEEDSEIPDAAIVRLVSNEMDAFLNTLQDDDIQMFGGRRSDAAFKRKDIGEDDDSSSNSGSDYESDEGRRSRSRPSKNKKWKDAEEEEGPCSSGSLGRRPTVSGGVERKDLLNTSSYRRREKKDLCPSAAPIKTKLGRNPEAEIEDASLPVTEEERLFSEADVKLACAALKTNEITPKADITSPLPNRFTGSIMSTMMRTLHVSKEATIRRYEELKLPKEVNQSTPIFLNGILRAEHLVYITTCVDAKARLDNRKWLIDLADVVLHNEKYEMLQFCTRTPGVAPFPYGKKDKSIDCLEFTHRLREIKNMMKMDLYKLAGSGRVIAMQINEATGNVQSVKTQKYELLEKFQDLYYRENMNDAKFDEMSITGIRGVKMMMEPPYFKTEDGMLSFEFPNANRNAQKNHMPFPVRKQKWTQKDLKALKQAIKECVVSQRIDDLNGRYSELLLESEIRRKDEMCREGKPMDEVNQPPRKRRRGRPTKEETKQRDKYGIVYPVFLRTQDHTVAYEMLPKQLSEWRTMMEKRLRNMSFDTLMKDKNNDKMIDWDEVSLKMMTRTKKLRSDDDCSRTNTHAIDPKINHKRLTAEQTRQIQYLNDVEKVQDWDEIARRISVDKNGQPTLPHTAFQCMKRYITHVAPPPKPVWTKEMDEKLKTGIQENPGHWRKVAASLNHEGITKRVAQERYRKLNPFIKVGPFSRTEDCLLLLTMQRLKPFLCDEGHLGYVYQYLSWRYETAWRDRATNLFNDWIVPWTLEEDRLLMDLAVSMNRNWQKISEQFSSFKNRKGCSTRYNLLSRNLAYKHSTLEEYHEAYAMTRYNVFQYRHLPDILRKLTEVKEKTLPSATPFCFPANPQQPPTEEQLVRMMEMFNRDILLATITSLDKYIQSRDEYWGTWNEKNGVKQRTFDRRTFHPDNPQSVASALHIRGLKLKLKEGFDNLNDFEEEIYVHYSRFSCTKTLKAGVKRTYLPPVSFFYKWKAVERIIEEHDDLAALEEEEQEAAEGAPVPQCSKKWTRLIEKINKEDQDENSEDEDDSDDEVDKLESGSEDESSDDSDDESDDDESANDEDDPETANDDDGAEDAIETPQDVEDESEWVTEDEEEDEED
ncbi:uncharacterized protein LOC110856913 [Folsomia candida]|uniref:snRNA-activating protein complex subunit 4 n=1 Tax=Folsomia candida TaxID=158441 RepID=A0A226DKX4_FOLCA|nr:uncharacterized protein LOC110856913 [Folsomia candida]OXA45484.1 snRNA-activating protein complex subunit 4 [Folsomia candida]